MAKTPQTNFPWKHPPSSLSSRLSRLPRRAVGLAVERAWEQLTCRGKLREK